MSLPTENYDRWQLIMRDCLSPQSYIDFGFYSLISAALQRRVWFGDISPNIPGQLYLNSFTALVGPPATGKGRVIIRVNELLKSLCIDFNSTPPGNIILTPDEHDSVENYAFPCGPDNLTYEQICTRISKSIRRTNNPNPNALPAEPKVYSHSSCYFCLEELTSLFQHDSKKICDFLLKAWDCTDFRRETKTQGSDQLKKPSLTILAGVTPVQIEELFTDRLLSGGLASRFLFIYEMSARAVKWEIKSQDKEQLIAKQELIEYLRKLWYVYGKIDFTPDADAYMAEWWQKEALGTQRSNKSIKLDDYYGRKKEHTKKLAGILHLSEPFDFSNGTIPPIPVETAIKATEILYGVEKRMHYAVEFGGRNPLAAVSKKIINYFVFNKKPLTGAELLDVFHSDLREIELQECLRFMTMTGRISKNSKGKYYPTVLLNGISVDSTGDFEIPEPLVNGHGHNRITAESLKALPLDRPI